MRLGRNESEVINIDTYWGMLTYLSYITGTTQSAIDATADLTMAWLDTPGAEDDWNWGNPINNIGGKKRFDLIVKATQAKPKMMTGPLPLEVFRKPGTAGLPPYCGIKLGFTHAPDAYRILCSMADQKLGPKLMLASFEIVNIQIFLKIRKKMF